jgi:hypothetical protein
MLTQSSIIGRVSSRAGCDSASGRLCHTISSIAVLCGGRGAATFGDADATLAAPSATCSSLPARPRSRESHAQTLLHGCDESFGDLGADECGLVNTASISWMRKRRWSGRANRRGQGQGQGRVRNRASRTKFPGLGRVFNSFHRKGQGSHALLVDSRVAQLHGLALDAGAPVRLRWSSAEVYTVPGPWDGAERQPLAPSLLEASKSVQLSIIVAMASLRRHNHIRTFTSTITHDSQFPPPGASPHLTQWRLSLFDTSGVQGCCWAPIPSQPLLLIPSLSSPGVQVELRLVSRKTQALAAQGERRN